MTYIPGFDPKTFSDEEIMKRHAELCSKINYAARFGLSTDMIAQMQNMIMALEMERRERMFVQMNNVRQKMFPDIIESDPSMIVKKQYEDEENVDPAQRRRKTKERLTLGISKTPQPVNISPLNRSTSPARTPAPTISEEPTDSEKKEGDE